jgi:hypothetical protein
MRHTPRVTPVEVAVRTVVDLLVRREYDGVERMTEGARMSAAEISEAIAEYGRTLVRPDPAEWWPLVEITPVAAERGKLHVAAPLWTAEEGRSDLMLELWLHEVAPELYRATLLNIHVL